MELIETEVEQGRLLGIRPAPDLAAFLGVPYAAPPVGPRRFLPALPPAGWTGVRPATAYAPSSVQPPPDPASAVPGDPMEQSEDCLYLNVWTPGTDESKRPVMVWIHGGGYVGGSPSSALYSGQSLSREGVVVVTVGYRLGVLGWLGHPALAAGDGELCSNWGLSDQLAALSWIRRNAAAFGGDPENVTVFGESAGAISIAALLAGDRPRESFDRAIMQSGAPMALSLEAASRVAEELAAVLGLTRLERRLLENVPTSEILRAQSAIRQRLSGDVLAFQPVVDGLLLPGEPAGRIASGSAAGVDLLIGTNRDEWRFWLLTDPALRALDWAGAISKVEGSIRRAGLGERLGAAELVESYKNWRLERGEPAEPADVYCAIASDWTFRLPSMRLAEAQAESGGRVSAYLFDWESPLLEGRVGACHAIELPFVFGTLDHPFITLFSGGGELADRLSGAMRSAWASFATSGDASSELVGPWPAYGRRDRLTKRLGREIETISASFEPERRLLDEAFPVYGDPTAVGSSCAVEGT
jgi:para-nitrobenzyl esterase